MSYRVLSVDFVVARGENLHLITGAVEVHFDAFHVVYGLRELSDSLLLVS